jgi:hypothetical protein
MKLGRKLRESQKIMEIKVSNPLLNYSGPIPLPLEQIPRAASIHRLIAADIHNCLIILMLSELFAFIHMNGFKTVIILFLTSHSVI